MKSWSESWWLSILARTASMLGVMKPSERRSLLVSGRLSAGYVNLTTPPLPDPHSYATDSARGEIILG